MVRSVYTIPVGMPCNVNADTHLIQQLSPFLVDGFKVLLGIEAERYMGEDHSYGVFLPFAGGYYLAQPLGLFVAVGGELNSTTVFGMAVYLVLACIQNETEDTGHFYCIIRAGFLTVAGDSIQIMRLGTADLMIAAGVNGRLTTLGHRTCHVKMELDVGILGQLAGVIASQHIDIKILVLGDL